MLDPALDQRYGVPAINILNDLSLEAVVLQPPSQERSPVIVQTSVKTVRIVSAHGSSTRCGRR